MAGPGYWPLTAKMVRFRPPSKFIVVLVISSVYLTVLPVVGQTLS
jgi:hypothetical protein